MNWHYQLIFIVVFIILVSIGLRFKEYIIAIIIRFKKIIVI